MKTTIIQSKLLFAFTLLIISVIQASAQSTPFTYQGKLSVNGSPTTGNYEMRFTLEDVDGFGLGTPVTIPSVTVTQGIFTVQLDFGSTYFDQSDRFLKIEIRQAGNPMPPPFTLLTPRQQITPAPKAVFSNASSFAVSSANALQLGGVAASQYVQKNASGEIVAPRLENLAADPEAASAKNIGRVYFNTTTGNLTVSDGTQWRSLSRKIQTFYANTTFAVISCTSNIRSVSFTKNSASTRLRVTYRDSPYVGSFGTFSPLEVVVKIDGANFSPVSLSNSFRLYALGGGSYESGEEVTMVGYAEGISAGMHTFTSRYVGFSSGSPICYRPRSYLIENEELPSKS